MVFPAVTLYLEKAFGGDTDAVCSSWISDLETSCLIYQDGTDNTKLENGVESAACFVLSSQLFHTGVTQSLILALCWDTVTFPGAVWSSILICSHNLLPRMSSSVAMKLLAELGRWLQGL